jgi:hypothetical protein
MAFAGSKGRGEADEADDDEDDRVGVAEIEEAAAHLCQQKENADGDNDDGPHEAADGATLASATNTIAHLYLTSVSKLANKAPKDDVPCGCET